MKPLKILALCLIGCLAAAFRGGAQTQTPAPAFVDADGDGINDIYQGAHRLRGKLRASSGNDWRAALAKLKLTSGQELRIKQIASDHQKAVSPLQTALDAAQAKLKETMRAPQPDPSLLATQNEAISGLRSQIQRSMAAYQSALQGVLTPEQWTALSETAREYGTSRVGTGVQAKKGTEDLFIDEDGDGICDGRGIGRRPIPPGKRQERGRGGPER